jgi:hypothetical protein
LKDGLEGPEEIAPTVDPVVAFRVKRLPPTRLVSGQLRASLCRLRAVPCECPHPQWFYAASWKFCSWSQSARSALVKTAKIDDQVEF